MWTVPGLNEFYSGIYLTNEEKVRKNFFSQNKKNLSQGKKNLSQIYMKLNMFWATHRPSSGA
jgi:hypothetical protein